MPLGSCSISCSDVVLEQGDKEICPEIFGVLFFSFVGFSVLFQVFCGVAVFFVVVVFKDLLFQKGL